jgi:hypothetical protein
VNITYNDGDSGDFPGVAVTFEVFALGTYEFTFTVTDSCGLSSSDTVTVSFYAEAACAEPTQNPCQRGTCVPGSTASTYTCDCVSGFDGTNCEVNLGTCPKSDKCRGFFLFFKRYRLHRNSGNCRSSCVFAKRVEAKLNSGWECGEC